MRFIIKYTHDKKYLLRPSSESAGYRLTKAELLELRDQIDAHTARGFAIEARIQNIEGFLSNMFTEFGDE